MSMVVGPKLQSGTLNLVAIYGPLKTPSYKHFPVPNRVVSIESLGQSKRPNYKTSGQPNAPACEEEHVWVGSFCRIALMPTHALV